ncbi:SDR family NAD(P)-dependent oxidoreductase [Microbacterium lushaniae]|uniref:SDR family NAD(P)-dependent oxidoreductase n=1 Tax=Microbacterium lushaniae TaxID=2614639 RepID=A0A5J6KZY8_9MICO|nr:SDR family NAD(P)-dependent oxidoreductase [Microbacterium lushaniae]QEW01788.1 SDR family NAD(P)-dependent oxidoreductase [Microbacterium lushaniae]
MSVAGRVAVVTGATGGMGRVISRELVRNGMHVVAVARDASRAEAVLSQGMPGSGTWEVVAGDLSDRAGVMRVAGAIADRHDAVHVLVNNAGAHYAHHRRSSDGIEMHIAVDYLAAFGLTVLLEEQLRRGRARVVNVASDSLRDTRRITLLGTPRPVTLDVGGLDDLARLNPAAGFIPFEAYARAKLLTVTAGYRLARTFAGEVTVNAVHPGIVSTDIIDSLIPAPLRPLEGLIRPILLTPEQGAAATLRLAVDAALEGVTGRYFVRAADTPTPPISYDPDVQDRLRETSDRFFRGDAVA